MRPCVGSTAAGSFEIGAHDSVIRVTGPGPGDEPVLWAKYLDWCSARVAERFLKLTPDEIYERAQEASSREAAGTQSDIAALRPVGGDAPVADAGEPAGRSFGWIVERVTEALSAELELPGFEEWAKAYRAAPAEYDAELLGLWREGA